MKRKLQGRYLQAATAGEAFKAFVPAPLPPRPVIDWTPALRGRFDAALVALGRLDAVTARLADRPGRRGATRWGRSSECSEFPNTLAAAGGKVTDRRPR